MQVSLRFEWLRHYSLALHVLPFSLCFQRWIVIFVNAFCMSDACMDGNVEAKIMTVSLEATREWPHAHDAHRAKHRRWRRWGSNDSCMKEAIQAVFSPMFFSLCLLDTRDELANETWGGEVAFTFLRNLFLCFISPVFSMTNRMAVAFKLNVISLPA